MTPVESVSAPDTIAELLAEASRRLAPRHESHRLDAELLLAHVLQRPRSHLYTWPQQPLDREQRRRFAALLERRAAGEPVAYLLGRREFWSLILEVGPATLIPRPETELLIELALAHMPAEQPCRVLDLGTGSGAIALALANERPGWSVTAVDSSLQALEIARRNRARLGLTSVGLVAGDWYGPFADQRFDIILSNPPYVRRTDRLLGQGDVQHEPRGALDGGTDGLDSLRRVIAGAPSHLARGGLLIVEHGADQGEAVATLMAEAGLSRVEPHADLAGLPRATSARSTTQ